MKKKEIEPLRQVKEKANGVFDLYLESIKGIDKFSDIPTVKQNPFMNKLLDKVIVKRKMLGAKNAVALAEMVDTSTGEVIDGIQKNMVFMKQAYVDPESFIKIYIGRFKELYNLSLPAIKVFGFILEQIQEPSNINNDRFYFSMRHCKEFCKYNSHPQIYRGLTELIQHGFIAKSDENNWLFLDFTASFNGNRITIMEEYIKKDVDYFSEPQNYKLDKSSPPDDSEWQ